MGNPQNRYAQMERLILKTLLVGVLFFVLYLITAGFGIIWLKITLAILTMLISLGVLIFLYLCGEILRKRSLWMSTASASLFLCTLVSLILNYPSPV